MMTDTCKENCACCSSTIAADSGWFLNLFYVHFLPEAQSGQKIITMNKNLHILNF